MSRGKFLLLMEMGRFEAASSAAQSIYRRMFCAYIESPHHSSFISFSRKWRRERAPSFKKEKTLLLLLLYYYFKKKKVLPAQSTDAWTPGFAATRHRYGHRRREFSLSLSSGCEPGERSAPEAFPLSLRVLCCSCCSIIIKRKAHNHTALYIYI